MRSSPLAQYHEELRLTDAPGPPPRPVSPVAAGLTLGWNQEYSWGFVERLWRPASDVSLLLETPQLLKRMKEIIPLISSDTAGPLGVKHLPRLWLKTLLSAAGHLPEGYKDVRPGFDHMVLEGLGIDPDSARAFIIGNRPTYLAFERWVCEQPNVDISAVNISKINEAIESRTKSPEIRVRMLTDLGLPENSLIESSVMLNNLDDWKSIHAQVTE